MTRYDSINLLRFVNHEPALTIEYAHYLCRNTLRTIQSLNDSLMRLQRRAPLNNVTGRLEAAAKIHDTVTGFLDKVAAMKSKTRRHTLSEPLSSLRNALERSMELLRLTQSGRGE
jgi:hypothetical protein